MTVLNPGRLAAGRVLLSVERGGHAEDLLAELAPAAPSDRRLAWHLALGVLRRMGSLDALLEPVAGRSMAKVDPPARAALRVGLFEVHLSRAPVHAALDQAVELCRRLGAPRATGFVNAVLRKAVDRPLDLDPYLDLPPWLAERWRGRLDAWVASLARPAPLAGVWRDAAAPVEGLSVSPAMAGGQLVPGAFLVVEPQGPVEALPGFAEGRWWVMDPAAVAVADLVDPRPGRTVLDACAAPGGKSLRMAAAGAQVLAVDLVPERLARVDEAAARTGLPVATRQHDWLEGPLPGEQTFDAVLVDAPCTGLGTIRRHPEIRWRRQPTDPAGMALRQRRILAHAAQAVAPGGSLVYAVCSPLPEEGDGVVERLAGWRVERELRTGLPDGDEDAFQAFVLRRAD